MEFACWLLFTTLTSCWISLAYCCASATNPISFKNIASRNLRGAAATCMLCSLLYSSLLMSLLLLLASLLLLLELLLKKLKSPPPPLLLVLLGWLLLLLFSTSCCLIASSRISYLRNAAIAETLLILRIPHCSALPPISSKLSVMSVEFAWRVCGKILATR